MEYNKFIEYGQNDYQPPDIIEQVELDAALSELDHYQTLVNIVVGQCPDSWGVTVQDRIATWESIMGRNLTLEEQNHISDLIRDLQ